MLTFIAVVLLLFLIPGPAVFLTVAQTIKGGSKAGIATGVGIAIGDLIHSITAILGLSAIVLTSAYLFELIKYAGAAYLVFLGIQAFMTKSEGANEPEQKSSERSVSVRQAILIEVLNPKTALFFLAFLPQFVQPEKGPIVLQLSILGLTFVILSIMYTTLLAITVSFVGERFLQNNRFLARWQNKLVGTVYVGLGLKLAF